MGKLVKDYTLIKKADDMTLGVRTIRVSIGGVEKVRYCLYRGDLKEVIAYVEGALEALKSLDSELEISPNDGKKFA